MNVFFENFRQLYNVSLKIFEDSCEPRIPFLDIITLKFEPQVKTFLGNAQNFRRKTNEKKTYSDYLYFVKTDIKFLFRQVTVASNKSFQTHEVSFRNHRRNTNGDI